MPWHGARAIAHAHAVTHTIQEKRASTDDEKPAVS